MIMANANLLMPVLPVARMSNVDLVCDDPVCFCDSKTSPCIATWRRINETEKELAPITRPAQTKELQVRVALAEIPSRWPTDTIPISRMVEPAPLPTRAKPQLAKSLSKPSSTHPGRPGSDAELSTRYATRRELLDTCG